MNRRRFLLGLGALGGAAVGGLAGCGLRGPASPADLLRPRDALLAPRPEIARQANVLFVSIDTLRADHLGCYGYDRPTSPNIDAWARETLHFELNTAQAPTTHMSHASLFTSLIPAHHGCIGVEDGQIASNVPTAGEMFRAAGYATLSVNGGVRVDRRFGFARGFDTYDSRTRDFTDAVDDAIVQIKTAAPRPWFMFLHTYQPHHPHTPRPEHLALFDANYAGPLPDHIDNEKIRSFGRRETALDAADVAHIVATYDAEIYAVDLAYAKLIDFLKSAGLYDNTMIVFTSDHGVEFGEHGRMATHLYTLYDELTRVPLLIKFPRDAYAGQRIAEQTRGIDVLPTIMATVGLQRPDHFEGVDLIDWLAQPAQRELIAISQRNEPGLSNQVAARLQHWKLYGSLDNAASRLLYELATNPTETPRKLDPPRTAIREYLNRTLAEALPPPFELEFADTAPLSPELRKKMQELGYLN
jgi:arylsulfatase A-like enzyme